MCNRIKEFNEKQGGGKKESREWIMMMSMNHDNDVDKLLMAFIIIILVDYSYKTISKQNNENNFEIECGLNLISA